MAAQRRPTGGGSSSCSTRRAASSGACSRSGSSATGRAAPAALDVVPIPPSRAAAPAAPVDPRLEARLASGDDPLLAPLRVAWQPPKRGRRARARGSRDLLTFGDPRDPGRLRQAWVLRRHPERCRIVAGEPAPLSELRERWRRAGGADVGADRPASPSSSRGRRRSRSSAPSGACAARATRCRASSREEIVARPAFRGGVARLARELGPTEADGRCARRDALPRARSPPTHSPLRHRPRRAPDPLALHARLRRGAPLRPRSELERIYALAQRHPVVFLPSHKSNLDHLVLQYALHENGHPPNHTAGGINMNFFPVGPLVRRSGVFFIRRTLQGQRGLQVRPAAVHRLPDREALLARVVHRGRALALGEAPAAALRAARLRGRRVPARQERGRRPHPGVDRLRPDPGRRRLRRRAARRRARSARASAGSSRVVRALRRRYGDIHIRFGEPVSLREGARPARPERRAERRRAEPGAPEARVRGVRCASTA